MENSLKNSKFTLLLKTMLWYSCCLVPRPLAVFHLSQSVLDHVVRAKKRGLDKNQKLRQIVSIFPGVKAVRAMAEKSVEVVSSNSFSTQMRNASINKSFSSVCVLNSFSEETNGPYGTALSSRKRLFDEQFLKL